MPQATLLAAMLALERSPCLRVETPHCEESWAPLIQTRVGRISEKFSFGKTVGSLALICAQPVPTKLPEMAPLVTYPIGNSAAAHSINRAFVSSQSYDSVGVGFLPELSIRYTRFLPVTIVAAAANVISQWEDNTRRFTTLKYFTIENVRSLREFEEIYRAGRATDYNLIFVKIGRVTTSFVIEGEPERKSRAKNRSMLEALSRLLEGVPVARLIIDDYDTIKLAGDDCFMPALFTWLISATRRETLTKTHLQSRGSVEEFLRDNSSQSFPILGVTLDDIVNKVFSLHCAPAYVDSHINSTAIGFRRVFVRGGIPAAMLRALDVPAEIIEMVNADAVGTAAQALGIEAHSIGDVIHKVVGTHLNKLRHAVRALARVENARRELGSLGTPAEKDKEVIKALRAALKDGTDADVETAVRAVSGAGRDVNASLDSLAEWAEAQKTEHGKALTRMRDNIREGHCQCCQIPFRDAPGEDEVGVDASEAAYVMAGCCQIIVCEPCITRPDDRGRGRKNFIRRCPNCARDLNIRTGLIRVGAELDLESALTDDTLMQGIEGVAGDDTPGAQAVADAGEGRAQAGPDGAADRVEAIDNPKLKALIQLLKGRMLTCLRDVATPPYVAGLLAGRRHAPWPDGKLKKFLVFAVHSETTAVLSAELARYQVPFAVLRGTRAQKDEAVRRIRSGEAQVLVVTTPKDCAGLDLPFLSHVVFYHRVLDRNVEAQVAARGQRLGREHNLEILTLVNEAEAEGL